MPSSASQARPQPTSRRTGLDDCPRRTSETPAAIRATGMMKPADADDPAQQQLDAATERAGEVEVQGQGDDDAGDDQGDADELVLAPADGPAQLVGGGLAAASASPAGCRWRRPPATGAPATARRRSATGSVGAAGPARRRGDGAAGGCRRSAASRLLLRWAPGGHDREQRYQGGVAPLRHPADQGLQPPGSTDCTVPSAASVTSSVPPSSDCTPAVYCDRAARAAGDREQHDVGVRQLVGHAVEDGRRVERRAPTAANVLPAALAGGPVCGERAADVHVRRHRGRRRRRRRTG